MGALYTTITKQGKFSEVLSDVDTERREMEKSNTVWTLSAGCRATIQLAPWHGHVVMQMWKLVQNAWYEAAVPWHLQVCPIPRALAALLCPGASVSGPEALLLVRKACSPQPCRIKSLESLTLRRQWDLLPSSRRPCECLGSRTTGCSACCFLFFATR